MLKEAVMDIINYSFGISVKEPRQTTKSFGQDSQSPGWHLMQECQQLGHKFRYPSCIIYIIFILHVRMLNENNAGYSDRIKVQIFSESLFINLFQSVLKTGFRYVWYYCIFF
jgi:hypothetical protein